MRSVVVIFCTLASLIVVSNAAAYIIHVPGDYPSIQEGIDHAWNGDTVLVAPGTYAEHINFGGRNIVLGSMFLTTEDTSYISATIIDGYAVDRAISFVNAEDSTAQVVGFTIQNGSAENGGGILCYNASSPTIRNNIFVDNYAHKGGGLLCWQNSSAIIEYNIFFQNEARNDGGGICCWSSSPTIRGNVFRENTAEHGGGIYCNSSSPIVAGNLIVGNSALFGGGLACLTYSAPALEFNLVANNTAGNGGGLYCYYLADPMLNNITFDNNEATYATGSGIFCQGSCDPVLTNTIISNGTTGYGIFCIENSIPQISYCDVWNNASGNYSGCTPGEGCISADPLFCDSENENYYLHVNSPCKSTGEGGADMGAFEVECGSVVLTAGPDQDDTANTQVPVFFYVENKKDSADTFDLDVSDELGWSIEPTHYELALDTNEVDTVSFTVSIPYVQIGASDRIVATAVSQSDPIFYDSDFLHVTCTAFLEDMQVTPGDDQTGYANSVADIHFIFQNTGVVADSYSLDLSDTQGWDIAPLHYDLDLDTAESQQVDFIISIPYVPLGTTDVLTLLGVSRTNPFARDSASLTVTCNAFAEGWDLTSGSDINTPANTEVTAVFYVENTGLVTDSCNLSMSDLLGWDVEPQACTLTLDSGQFDSVSFEIQVPSVPVGTTNELTLTGTSLTNPYAIDLASVNVTCDSRTIFVPADFSTIQSAIDFSSDWDLILVAPGTYYEHIFFDGKAIVLRSENGRDSTTIAKIAGGVSMVSFISGEDSNSVLDGFTITGGMLESGQGAGINCVNSSPKILNNRIVNNSCPYGAGIACDNHSSPLIAGNLIEDNIATWFGGGVYCFDESSPVILQNVIRGNRADENGGGVYCQGLSSPSITENIFAGNTAFISGGGMCFRGPCSPIIAGNLISDNTAQTNAGGGIAVLVMSTIEMINNTLDRNSAAAGGGIYLDATSTASVANTIVTNSLAGKGIRAEGAYPTIIYCDVWNNLDENYYGCFPGVGCLSEDPLFCDPGSDNYYLWITSPCLGTGQDGTDIGAFGQGCSSAGDANADGEINVGDIVYVVNYLYKGGPPPVPVAAGDVNCDGTVDVGDVVYLVNYLFRGGPPPCEP